MARDTSKTGKTETLTIRLDPKTRFILDYISRLRGQTITTVVERAIISAATEEAIYDENGYRTNWDSFWDVSEGARALNIASRKEFFPTFEEEKRLAFCREHWPFFYRREDAKEYRYPFLNILWPRIDEFIAIHDQTVAGGEYWAAGKAMREALIKAGIAPPDWPVKKPPKPAPKSRGLEMDDDIPF